jgi:hypothetical protein
MPHEKILWPLQAIVLALGFAFATSGFSHHITTPEEQERIAYATALGLAVDEICAEPGQQQHRRSICEACLVGPFLTLPSFASPVAPLIPISCGARITRDLGPIPHVGFGDANRSRAPPPKSSGVLAA